ncbi:hypothetical protein V8C34DRAFT_280853, partial [Trichoderma compactum]
MRTCVCAALFFFSLAALGFSCFTGSSCVCCLAFYFNRPTCVGSCFSLSPAPYSSAVQGCKGKYMYRCILKKSD